MTLQARVMAGVPGAARVFGSRRDKEGQMSGAAIYSDKLVEITEDSITFKNYCFPFGSKRVQFVRIDRVELREPSLASGEWRLWGTSFVPWWFPLDRKRPSKDKIFVVQLRDSTRRIGFTVENSSQVQAILRNKGLLAE